jgi:hypothetical protein
MKQLTPRQQQARNRLAGQLLNFGAAAVIASLSAMVGCLLWPSLALFLGACGAGMVATLFLIAAVAIASTVDMDRRP